MSIKKLIIIDILIVALVMLALFASPVTANSKVTICHAAGREGTTKYITLNISENAVYGRKGNAGHFEENGTPRAGHEQDYFGPCLTDTESSTPTPSESETPMVTPTPTSTPESSIGTPATFVPDPAQTPKANTPNTAISPEDLTDDSPDFVTLVLGILFVLAAAAYAIKVSGRDSIR